MTQAHLAGRYDRAASTWDTTLGRLGFDRVYEALSVDLATMGILDTLTDSASVLDIGGVGTGALISALLRHTPGLPHVTGIDISHAMLCAASLHLTRLGVAHTLMQADLAALRDYPHVFDAVVCAHVVEHLSNPSEAIAQIHDLLVPGGRFVLVITRRGLWGQYLRQKWRVAPPALPDLRGWFRAAGFVDVTPIRLHGNGWVDHASVAMVGTRSSD